MRDPLKYSALEEGAFASSGVDAAARAPSRSRMLLFFSSAVFLGGCFCSGVRGGADALARTGATPSGVLGARGIVGRDGAGTLAFLVPYAALTAASFSYRAPEASAFLNLAVVWASDVLRLLLKARAFSSASTGSSSKLKPSSII